ncbi:MAG TPA: threonine--tRNA ligase [Firmicutes bacterium]|nr:threonine--tRNA ligase [Bacillota bacterium]
MVKITLPDGSVIEAAKNSTAHEVAKAVSPRLYKEAVAAKINGELVDLSRAIDRDVQLELVTAESKEGLEVLRHSTAHLMAHAIKRLFPEVKLAIGPVVENRFYYDIDTAGRPLSVEDFPAIEAQMAALADQNLPLERVMMKKEEALAYFRASGDQYKEEIISELEDEQVSLYRQGDFIDLCRGPHVPSTGKLKVFKLLSVAGAYWRGDANRPMLQRIYGTAWAKKSELDAYIKQLEEAARRDHRKLGPELDLFSFREESPGFVFWHPKGWTLYRLLEDFSRQVQARRNYQEVATPWISPSGLWERSGHWYHFRENMFIINTEENTMAVKPMNCPYHCLLYKEQTRSYRDLPLKFSEYGPLARYEKSGTLHGALRVWGLHQDDAHLYIREDQIAEQISEVLGIVDEIYSTFGMPYKVNLSTRPENYMGDPALWEKAEAALVEALEAAGLPYEVQAGEGAFYGPKLDFDVTDAIGRTWQCATIQLDFQLPIKFDLTYVDSSGQERRPVMIHRAILGSMERFLGVLVEHYAGAFPLWLSPVQAVVLPITDALNDYAGEVAEALRQAGFRVEVDGRSEKIGYKIRQAQMQKVPYMIILGEKEKAAGNVAVRHRSEGDLGQFTLPELLSRMAAEVKNRG